VAQCLDYESRVDPAELCDLGTLKLDLARVTPPPSIYWNLGVREKTRFDLWAAVSYGQNLEPEGLSAAEGADFVVLRGKYGRFENLSHGHGEHWENKSVENVS
jgi:hypothetical protein